MNRSRLGYFLSKVPDEFQIRCAARADRLSTDQWEIGRDANMLWAIAVRDKWEMWKHEVYDVVAALHNHAIAPRTVRHYASIVEFYDAEERQEAREKFYVLPFAHFAFARTYGDLWEQILDASLKRIPENNGLPPSVSWLDAHFRGVTQAKEVLAIDNGTQELDEYRDGAEIDFDDLPNIAEIADVDGDVLGTLSSQEHAMVQGIARSLRFLTWVCGKLEHRGLQVYQFEDAVEKLKVAAGELMGELTAK